MSSFSSSTLEKKLSDLSGTQQGVQTLSLWVIHHRKHAKLFVQAWQKELLRAKEKKKLTLLYVANDILQNSRKKGPEFIKEFSIALPASFHHCAKECSENTTSALGRILEIWQERDVYDKIFIDRLKRGMVISTSTATEDGESPPPTKRMKAEELKMPTEVPDPDDLIERLQGLESCATQDAVVREQIANLPSEVTTPSHLEQIEDVETGEKLMKIIVEACDLLDTYNERLQKELEERETVLKMLSNYIDLQKYQLVQTEATLEEHRAKLSKVTVVRKELKSHLESLPDLSKLPDAQGLAPLPSAGDLFAKSS